MITPLKHKRASEAGFTLVELAIVLVIIGLIVGGVLVGQDLIKAAEIRNTVSTFEKYNSAALAFRNRFGGLPGDLLSSRANQYGMPWLTARTGVAGRGDGNGVIEGCTASAQHLGCETIAFWSDLTFAQLIADAFLIGASGCILTTETFPAAALATVDLRAKCMPRAALRDNANIHIYPGGGRNYYGIHSYSTVATTGIPTFSAAGARALTAAEAAQIDEKMDDGKPSSGVVIAMQAYNVGLNTPVNPDAGSAGYVTGACVNSTPAPTVYNTQNATFANELNCQLQVRASF